MEFVGNHWYKYYTNNEPLMWESLYYPLFADYTIVNCIVKLHEHQNNMSVFYC